MSLATSRRQALSLGSALLVNGVVPASFAADKAMTPQQCRVDCNKECNRVTPGNKDYCSEQCEDFCDTMDPTVAGSPAAEKQISLKDCSKYNSKEAKAYCDRENKKAIALKNPSREDLGIFGDSGVSYGRGVEDAIASAFGAKQQNKNVKEADIDGYLKGLR